MGNVTRTQKIIWFLQMQWFLLQNWWKQTKMYTRSRIRLLWYKLWIREDEFHNSLSMDIEALLTMNKKQKEEYISDLQKRRNIAHRRDMAR